MKKTLLVFILNISILSFINAQWQYVSNIPTTNNLYSVYFPTSDTGFTVGSAGTILKTVDSGNTWISQISNTSQNLQKVLFVNSLTGWAVGDSGTILKTSNGGNLWSLQNFNTFNYQSICFINIDTGYISGSYGTIIKTTDGGNNWVIKTSNTNYAPYYTYFKNNDTGFVGGIYDTILVTTNGGNNWTLKSFEPYNGNILSFNFINANIGFGTGINTVVKTTNGGETWTSLQDVLANYMPSLYFTGMNIGYIVGGNWSPDAMPIFMGSVILKTIDGGITWDSLVNIASSKMLNSIFFTNSNTGFIVGSNGTILKTSNGGETTIQENTKIQNINIYPNPANNNVFIEIPSNFLISKLILTISDINGRQIIEQQISFEKTEVNITNLPKGVYVVKVFNNNNVLVKKLVKQ